MVGEEVGARAADAIDADSKHGVVCLTVFILGELVASGGLGRASSRQAVCEVELLAGWLLRSQLVLATLLNMDVRSTKGRIHLTVSL